MINSNRILNTDKNCKLIGNFFSYFIQFILGIIVIFTLLFKRHFEIPKRAFKIWILDISKLMIGGFFIHFINISLSTFFLNSDNNNDECWWYFVNYFIDCTLGVLIVYISHSSICYIIKFFTNNQNEIIKIGYYGEPIILKIWIYQTLIYFFSLLLNKLLITILCTILKQELISLGKWMFTPFHNPEIELIFVMIIFPLVLSIFQFWTFDLILKYRSKYEFIEIEEE